MSTILKALIIDDEKSICETLGEVIRDEGWDVETANSGEEGIVKFKSYAPNIVFLDVWMPGIDGIETLQKIKGLHKNANVVVMSGHGNIETAVKATKLGAYDFLEKPMSLDKVIPIIEKIAEKVQAGDAPAAFKLTELIGESDAMKNIKKQISLVAPRNSWIFLTGENGTGKEVVARNIHYYSKRSDKPFIAVNCAAIPEDLIESELFGYVKGAFSNAMHTKKGKFELAHKGTLFLDEIGDMSLKTQAKVLRILQEQAFERLGDTETLNIDVRVIAATNKDLDREIKEGNFRQDLYYRLNVIPIHLCPMRDRREDVPLLMEHFLNKNSEELSEPKKQFTASAHQVLLDYDWPGNVRELKNLVERMCIMVSSQEISSDDLPEHVFTKDAATASEFAHSSSSYTNLREAKSDFEKKFILQSLKENDWNISKTAEVIGIERSNLHKKIKAYNIEVKDHK